MNHQEPRGIQRNYKEPKGTFWLTPVESILFQKGPRRKKNVPRDALLAMLTAKETCHIRYNTFNMVVSF